MRVTPRLVTTPPWIEELLASWQGGSEELKDGTGRRQIYLRGGRDATMRDRVALLRHHAEHEAAKRSLPCSAFASWVDDAARLAEGEMEVVAQRRISVDEDVLMLRGGHTQQPQHADLDAGGVQTFIGLGSNTPTRFFAGERPAFSDIALLRQIDLKQHSADDDVSLGVCSRSPELLMSRSELDAGVQLAVGSEVYVEDGVVRNPPGTATTLSESVVHGGNSVQGTAYPAPEKGVQGRLRSANTPHRPEERLVLFLTGAPPDANASPYDASVQYVPKDFAKLSCMSEEAKSVLLAEWAHV